MIRMDMSEEEQPCRWGWDSFCRLQGDWQAPLWFVRTGKRGEAVYPDLRKLEDVSVC